jgi:Icc-related predicted phosphoesterase
MLLVSDVHGEFEALSQVAARGEPLLILGDLLNFVDYRTMEGMLADIAGREFVAELTDLREQRGHEAARALWRGFTAGREDTIRRRYDERIAADYQLTRAALEGSESYVIYGNVDRPDMLRDCLPPGSRFVDGEVVDLEGLRVGFAGGGIASIGVPGEIEEEALARKLDSLGPVDMLCTHVAPAVRPLSRDVVGGRPKQSAAVLDYLLEHRPRWHYFGDIHQPQAISWRVGSTWCRNVGYFRATKRPVRHMPDVR